MNARKAIIALASVFLAVRAAACSCEHNPTVEESTKKSDLVFVGTVSTGELVTKGQTVEYKFIPTEVLKGKKHRRIRIRTGLGGGDCGEIFHIGWDYLIFASTAKDGKFYTHGCLANSRYDPRDQRNTTKVRDTVSPPQPEKTE